MTIAQLLDTDYGALASLSATQIIATSMMEVLHVPNYALLVRVQIFKLHTHTSATRAIHYITHDFSVNHRCYALDATTSKRQYEVAIMWRTTS